MKTKHFKGMNGLFDTLQIFCVAGIGMMTTQIQAGTTEPAPAPAEEELPSNWVDLTVGGAFIGGDKAAYQTRVQNGDFYGGISDMHWEKEANDITWTLDGHVLFGSEDYEIILGAEKMDLGYIEAGFRQFRTWYDGSGGYLQGASPSWYPADDEDLHLDRGELWFEAGLRMEDFPEITFRYTHGWRDGDKDSTMWGAPDVYGIAPSRYEIDEERDVFELDVAHALGNTDLALGLRYETIDNSDDRIFEDGAEVHTDGYEADIFNAHASSVTRFNEKMMLSFGYAFTNLNSDTFVSRTDSILGFNSGGANQDMNVANASFWWNPVKDLVIVPSIRAEWNDTDAMSKFFYVGRNAAGTGWANPTVDVDGNTLTEQIEVRYQGFENLLVYANAMFEQEDEDTDWVYYQDAPALVTDTPTYGQQGTRDKECDANRMKAVVGATWYARRGLSFAGEYYHKETDLDYDTENVGTGLTHFGDAHISSLDMSTDNFNLRMTWRPLSNVSLVTRYDWQKTTYDMVGFDGTLTKLPEIESGEYERNIISQSVTWMPIEQAYVQATVSWIMEETDTPANDQAPLRITDFDNDYVTANLTVGYALDQKTDITAGYSYYYASNYNALPLASYNAGPGPGSVGYGTDLEEHVFSVRLNRWINRNMVWNLGYGYYNSNDGTSGGYNDFDAHMVSTGLQIRF